MRNAAYHFSERALIWIDPATNYLAIDIFDLPRDTFEIIPPDPALADRRINTRDTLPTEFVRTVARTVQVTVHVYTQQPPTEATDEHAASTP